MNNKSKLNLYFAASPVQLICIDELRKKDCSENFKLFLFLRKNSHYANSQMYLTAELLGFKKYKIYWLPEIRIIEIFYEMLFIFQLKLSFKSKFKIHNLHFVIFDFRNLFLQSLRRFFPESKFTLIDDGFYTYVAHDKYMKRDIYLPIDNLKSFTGKIAKLFYFGSSYERLKKSSFNLFTIYADEINNKNAQMNNLSNLKERILIRDRKFDENKVYFIGTGMVERGSVEIEQELGLIKKLNEYWHKRGKEMYYIAKRRTSKEKLNIFHLNGIKTLKYNLPLELVVTQIDNIPLHYCSLGSTLQKSLQLILGNKIKVYKIDFEDFLRKSNDLNSRIFLDDVDIFSNHYSQISPNVDFLDFEEIIGQ